MIGHGRPASFALALARAALILCACLVGQRDGAELRRPPNPCSCASPGAAAIPTRWLGRIAVDEGTLSKPETAGIGSRRGRFHLARRGPSSAFGRSARTKSTASKSPPKLVQLRSCKLNSRQTTKARRHDWKFHSPICPVIRTRCGSDDRGNTLEVQVVPQPALRIVATRDPLIFAPGEQCSFEMTPAIPNLTPGTDSSFKQP